MMLYKYFPINNYLKASLAEKYLWFSPPSSFNDINDSNLRLDSRYTDEEIRKEFQFVEQEIYRSALKRGDYSNRPLDDISKARSLYSSALADRGPDGRPDHSGRVHASIEKALELRRQTIGISCFSQEDRNELLWAHYANAHYGVCLAIDSTFDRECFQQLEQVKYTSTLPKLKLLSHMGENLIKLYTTKSLAWSYEREVRAFQHTCGSHRMDSRCLVSLVFGLRASGSETSEVCSLIRKAYGQQVGLLKMSRDKTGELVIRALSY